ncbi:MAG: hypothetical protein ACI9NT_001113 [Bacteroidia bacterium]|jgi:hypothetical protein
MEDVAPNTHQKALSINLDDKIYGTIAEIGAAQEVARWFFRVGAAAGSIAKTMSAYDMQISDDIYGQAGRYVSRERVESMLDKEYGLLVDRLGEKRGKDTRFFAFCNTVSARNFAGTNECHGWVGLRYQSEIGGEPNTIILHINMLDDNNVSQQEAVGVLGVNLIYAAFLGPANPEQALASLAGNIATGRIEADLIDATGPHYAQTDSVLAGIAIVQGGLAQAVLLASNGVQQPPTEIIRKRPTVIRRGSLRAVPTIAPDELAAILKNISADIGEQAKPLLFVKELNVSSASTEGEAGRDLLLKHVRDLVSNNEWVLLTRLKLNYEVSAYLRRYSKEPLGYLVGVSTLAMFFSEKFYENSESELLEAIGKLFKANAKVYVQSMSLDSFRKHLESAGVDSKAYVVSDKSENVSIHNLTFSGPKHKLFQYLLESDWIVEIAP